MLSYLPTMSKSTILVILLATLIAKQAASQPPTKPNYFAEICRIITGNYTTNSTYETNLKAVLSDLNDQSSTASSSNNSAGTDSDNQVFGQYYCRGDINSQLCHDCIKDATATIFSSCYNFKSAVIYFQECTLRYHNESMVGIESELPRADTWSAANVTDPDKFGAVLEKTMDRIINESAHGNVSSFATGEGHVTQFETAYCLVQCSPDLNGTQCDTCLRAAYDLVPKWWSQFVLVFLPSCQLRYSTQGVFYPLKNAPPPQATSPMLPPPPPPAPVVTASPPPKGGSAMLRSRESMKLCLVIAAVAFASLCFG